MEDNQGKIWANLHAKQVKYAHKYASFGHIWAIILHIMEEYARILGQFMATLGDLWSPCIANPNNHHEKAYLN